MQDDRDGSGGPGGQRKRKESRQANSLLTTSGKLLRSGSTGVLLRVMICGHGSASPTHRPRSNRERMDGLTDTPGSVLPFRYRHGSSGHPSTNAVAGALQRPTRTLGRAALNRVLSGLAPGGVYLAAPVTRCAGGLLHHRFTLTPSGRTSGAVYSLWHLPAGYPEWALPTTLPCGARTFLGRSTKSASHAAAWPTHPFRFYAPGDAVCAADLVCSISLIPRR